MSTLEEYVPEFRDDPDLRLYSGQETATLAFCRTFDSPNVDEDTVSEFMDILDWLPPVVVDGAARADLRPLGLVTGDHRLTAAHRVGREFFPCVYVEE